MQMSNDENNTDRLLKALGLCVKAGSVVFGVPQTTEAMRRGGKKAPVLVLEAADTSAGTHKRLSDKCSFYRVKHVRIDCTAQRLAAALGKSAQLAAVGVTDEGISRLVEKYI